MRFKEFSYARALAVLQMLNLDTYSYVVEFYYRETLLATYNSCFRPVGVYLDWRVKDDVS